MKKISVIMPIYNSDKYLRKTIESILNQNFEDFELILVNDGSTDKSAEICDEYKKIDKKVKVIHKENGGISDARNVGIRNATGEYIMFSDNDDEFLPGAISDNYKLAKQNDADVVKYGRKAIYMNNQKVVKEEVRKFEKKVLEKEEINKELLKLLYNKVFVCIWDGIYKREIVKEFDTIFKQGGEDRDFNIKILYNTKKIVLNDKCYYNHYVRDTHSTSMKYSVYNLEIQKVLLIRLEKLLSQMIPNKNEKQKAIYNIILVRDFLNDVLANLANKRCPYTKKEKIKYLKNNIKINFEKVKFKEVYNIEKVFSVEYLLKKHKYDRVLLNMMSIYKNR